MNKTITLENDRLKAVIYPKRGANLIKLYDKKYKVDILRTPQNLMDFKTDNPYLYGMPLLFPPNRISDASFSFSGKEYKFPVNEPETGCFVHGTLHNETFDIIEFDSTSIKLQYSANNANLYHGYVNTFTIAVEYQLNENMVMHKVKITNTSSEDMPVGIGFHTTFNTDTNSELVIYANVVNEFERDLNYLPTGSIIDDSIIKKELNRGCNILSDNISAIFELGENHIIKMKLGEVKIDYILDDKYKYIMLLNSGSKGKYICVEPQSWLSNCPNLKDRDKFGFAFINPNETISYNTCISLT